jgi:hypothetical protein
LESSQPSRLCQIFNGSRPFQHFNAFVRAAPLM